QLYVDTLGVRTNPGDILVAGGGVDDQAEAVLTEPVGEQIIDDAGRIIEQAAVERRTLAAQAADIVGEQLLEQLARACAREIDDAHMRNIEHAGGPSYRLVLLDLRAVGHRHVPAAEVDHTGTERHVQSVKAGVAAH